MSTSNDPLWAKMLAAYVEVSGSFTDHLGNEQLLGPDREEMAAVLRVIADEVVPEEDFHDFSHGSIAEIMWRQRRLTRQRLLTEAERAEAGR